MQHRHLLRHHRTQRRPKRASCTSPTTTRSPACPAARLLSDRLARSLLGGATAAAPRCCARPRPLRTINDTLGHERGDSLLLEICARCRRVLRDTDTLARLSGTVRRAARRHHRRRRADTARRILDAIALPCRLGEQISIGEHRHRPLPARRRRRIDPVAQRRRRHASRQGGRRNGFSSPGT